MSHNNFIMPHSESESDLKVLDIKQEQEESIGDTEENMAESVKKEAEDVDTSKESNQDEEEEELAEDNNAPKPKEDSEESRSVSSDAAEVNDIVTAGSESEASKKKQEAPQPMKRRPERELNHDNWDQEDEPEEKGEFIKATQEQMKERKVLTAKRKQKPDLATNNNPFGGLSLLSLGAGNNGTALSLPKVIRRLHQRRMKRRKRTSPTSPLWKMMMLTMAALQPHLKIEESLSSEDSADGVNSATSI